MEPGSRPGTRHAVSYHDSAGTGAEGLIKPSAFCFSAPLFNPAGVVITAEMHRIRNRRSAMTIEPGTV